MPVLEHSASHASAFADDACHRPSTSTEAGSGTGQLPPSSLSSLPSPPMMMTSAAEPPKYEEAI